MFKRMSLVLGLVAALMFTTIAFAQTPVMRAAAAATTRISFAPGTTEYTLTTNMTPGVSQSYVLGVSAQQALFVLKSGDASVQVFGPLGDQLIAPNTQPGPYTVYAAQTGDYTIVLSGQGAVTLTVAVPPFGLPARL